jgi:hypothetical protein
MLAATEADWASQQRPSNTSLSSVDSAATVGSVQIMGRKKFKRHGTAWHCIMM